MAASDRFSTLLVCLLCSSYITKVLALEERVETSIETFGTF